MLSKTRFRALGVLRRPSDNSLLNFVWPWRQGSVVYIIRFQFGPLRQPVRPQDEGEEPSDKAIGEAKACLGLERVPFIPFCFVSQPFELMSFRGG